jgi:hypothetical protein
MYPVILAEFARRPITGARMLDASRILRQFSPVGENGTSLRLGFELRFAFSISWKISDVQIG